tara:strand:- start:176 stop:1351 length:1176 start_codon:yes stop_codon:yes gene_type:complete
MTFRFFIIFLVSFAFLFQVGKFYTFYLEYSPWQYGDWLINYQGGFIRRGLIGELFYSIYKFTNIKLDLIIFTSVILFYLLFSLILIKSSRYFVKSKLDYLLFLSPGFFLYPVMNSEIIGRKDIILVLVVGIFVFFKDIFRKNLNYIIVILSIIFLTLSHSGFLFYSQYLIVIYFFSQIKINKKIENWKFAVYMVLILGLGILVNLFSGNETQVIKICNSVSSFSQDNCTNSGQIGWLINNMSNYLYEKIEFGLFTLINQFIIYLISFCFIFIFLFKKIENSKFIISFKNIKNLKPIKLFIILILISLPIFILGRDWGRYIYLSYSCSIFLYIFLLKNNLIVLNRLNTPKFFKKKIIFLFFVFIYSFFWSVPFYDAKFFKFTLVKSIVNLIN